MLAHVRLRQTGLADGVTAGEGDRMDEGFVTLRALNESDEVERI